MLPPWEQDEKFHRILGRQFRGLSEKDAEQGGYFEEHGGQGYTVNTPQRPIELSEIADAFDRVADVNAPRPEYDAFARKSVTESVTGSRAFGVGDLVRPVPERRYQQ